MSDSIAYRSKLKRNGTQETYNLDRPKEWKCCGGANSECVINPSIYSTAKAYLIGRPYMSSDAPMVPEYFPDAPQVTTRQKACAGLDQYGARPAGNKYDLMEQPFRFEPNRDANNFYTTKVADSTRLEAADRAKREQFQASPKSRQYAYSR